MALKIRLSRVGTKNEPHYRVVVAEERSRRDGDAVEQLGSYNPRAKGNPMTIKLDRVDYWVSKGAKPTSTMHAMIKRARHSASVAPVAAAAPATRDTPAVAPVAPARTVEPAVPGGAATA